MNAELVESINQATHFNTVNFRRTKAFGREKGKGKIVSSTHPSTLFTKFIGYNNLIVTKLIPPDGDKLINIPFIIISILFHNYSQP